MTKMFALVALSVCVAAEVDAAPLSAVIPPRAAVAVASAEPAICGCSERFMPVHAQWRESHRMWGCTVVLPKVGGAPTVPCTGWGLERPPVGFTVRAD